MTKISNNEKELLEVLLGCNYSYISVLDNVNYNMTSIVRDVQFNHKKVTLEGIVNAIVTKGVDDLQNVITNTIFNLANRFCNLDADSKEYAELHARFDALSKLAPYNDIDWDYCCGKARLWFSKNENLYRTYLAMEIENIEYEMGFKFE